MGRLTIIDFEMNQPSGALIQLGAVRVDLRTGAIVKEFDEFINPAEKLSSYITELTGIEQHDVDNAMPVRSVLAQFWEWNEGRLVAAWGDDVTLLLRASEGLEHRKVRTLDIKSMAEVLCSAFTGKKSGGLLATMELFGLEFVGRQHNAKVDAVNTAYLVIEAVNRLRHYNEIAKILAS